MKEYKWEVELRNRPGEDLIMQNLPDTLIVLFFDFL